jgi:hypothetical protein
LFAIKERCTFTAGCSEFTPAITISIDPPTDDLTALFKDASSKYELITGRPLETHRPLPDWIGTCDIPEDVLDKPREQARAIGESDQDDELMESLDPIVSVLFKFSAAFATESLVSHLIHSL